MRCHICAILFPKGKDQKDVDYGVVVDMAFDEKSEFEGFLNVLANPEAAARLAEDESKFVDTGKTTIHLVSKSVISERQ